jgi:hypothetical protein
MAEKKSTKSSRLAQALTHQGFEIGISLAAGLYLGNLWWSPPIWILIYGLMCALLPKRACWWCEGSKSRTDGRGNYRDKNCWRCGNEGKVLRLGARVMGKGSTT